MTSNYFYYGGAGDEKSYRLTEPLIVWKKVNKKINSSGWVKQKDPYGNPKGKSPGAAARKIFKNIYESFEHEGKNLNDIKFTLVETTRGSGGKKITYVGNKIAVKPFLKPVSKDGKKKILVKFKKTVKRVGIERAAKKKKDSTKKNKKVVKKNNKTNNMRKNNRNNLKKNIQEKLVNANNKIANAYQNLNKLNKMNKMNKMNKNNKNNKNMTGGRKKTKKRRR